MLKLIEAQGNRYDCGRMLGAAMRENVLHRLQSVTPGGTFEKHQAVLPGIHDTCEQHYPGIVQELRGMAEGAGVDYWRLLLLNAPEVRAETTGCTTIAVNDGARLLLVHNEDGGSTERAEDCFLLHYTFDTGNSFYAFAYAGTLPGCSYNWNSDHLYFSVNYLTPIRPVIKGRVPRNFVARAMIEAASVEQAIARLRSSRDASGYHYYLGQDERFCSIENFGNEVSIKEIEGIDVHANHYLHPCFASSAPGGEHSQIRLAQAKKLVGQGLEPLQILTDRTHAPNAICTRPNESLFTISTVEFSPRERRVTLFEPENLKKEREFVL